MGRNNAVDFWNGTFISFPMMAAFPWNWSRSQDKHVICGQTAHPPSRQHQSVHNNDAQNLTQTRSHTGLLAISLNVLANFVSRLCRGGHAPCTQGPGPGACCANLVGSSAPSCSACGCFASCPRGATSSGQVGSEVRTRYRLSIIFPNTIKSRGE